MAVSQYWDAFSGYDCLILYIKNTSVKSICMHNWSSNKQFSGQIIWEKNYQPLAQLETLEEFQILMKFPIRQNSLIFDFLGQALLSHLVLGHIDFL